MFSWNSLTFSMIQRMFAIWSLVPLPFLKPAWTSGSSWFTYYWSLAWRILSITLLACEMSAIYGSYFCIHSASLCLLVGAFNPFTFKVTIYISVPVAIFLIVWGWFCKSFFLSCISWLHNINVTTFVVKLVWWNWILLAFACLKSFLFLHQFWMRSLPGTEILVVDFFPSLVFSHYISPFNICCKAGLLILNSLNFCLYEKLLISPSILTEIPAQVE